MKFLSDRGFDGVGVESDGRTRQKHRILDNLRLRMYGIADAKVNLHGLSNVAEPRLQANTGTNVLSRIANRFDGNRRWLKDHAIRGILNRRALLDELHEHRLIGNPA